MKIEIEIPAELSALNLDAIDPGLVDSATVTIALRLPGLRVELVAPAGELHREHATGEPTMLIRATVRSVSTTIEPPP